MQITINIEPGQMGETVLDIFQNLNSDEKRELAMQIMREWLQSPEFFETRNYEQIVIDEYRKGLIKPYSGRYERFYEDTPEEVIRMDYNFRKELEKYRTSKQDMVATIKEEITKYYKEQISSEIRHDQQIKKIKDDIIDDIKDNFPSIAQHAMVATIAAEFSNHSYNLGNAMHRIIQLEAALTRHNIQVPDSRSFH